MRMNNKGEKSVLADKIHELNKQVLAKEEELDALKKTRAYLPQSKAQRFQFIEDHSSEFTVEKMCSILEVSRSGFYKWRSAEVSPQAKRKALLLKRVAYLFEANHGQYGSPKITLLLREEGYIISERTVGKYMRELGLRASYAKQVDKKLEE
jgi:hypothetical protein